MTNNNVIIAIPDKTVRNISPTVNGLMAAIFYGICSVATAFTNKVLMTSMQFDYPVFIMVMQMIFTVIVLETLSFAKIITLPAYTLSRARNFMWPAVFYGANSVLALTALAHMNIAMYGVLKRCVPISTMFLALVILKKGLPTKLTLVSVILLTSGCVVAGYGDLFFHWNGYICGLFSNFTQAMYLLLVQKYSETEQSTVETLQLNSLNTLPLLIIACVVNGEFSTLSEYASYHQIAFYLMFLLAVTTGMLLNYSLFLCTGLTSALTTSVVGGLKAMAQTALGLVTFGGVSNNLPTYLGISLNLVGGILYIYAKYKESAKKLSLNVNKIMSYPATKDAYNNPGHHHIPNGKVGSFDSKSDGITS